MNFSLPTAQTLFGLPTKQEEQAPQEQMSYVQMFLQMISLRAKPKGQRSGIGPTHPLRGEIAHAATRTHKNSQAIQFSKETLPSGKSKYFKQNGEYVLRKQ